MDDTLTTTIAPLFTARIAGLPVTALDGLSDPDIAAALDGLVDTEEALRAHADDISDRLYEVIGSTEGKLRGRLVGLRRSVHNMRTPSASEWDATVRAHLPDEVEARVEAWTALLDKREKAAAHLAEVCAASATRTDGALRQSLDDPVFVAALRHANPDLLEQARRPDFGGAQRKARLARYVGRTAGKTSPRQWFGSWAIARTSDDTDVIRWHGDGRRLAVVEPALDALYERLGTLLGEIDMTRTDIAVRPVAGLWSDDEHWRFALPGGDVVVLRRTPAVDAVLEAAQAAESADALVAELTSHTGDETASRQFVGQLLGAGVLERRFAPSADDMLDQLVDGWRSVLRSVDQSTAELTTRVAGPDDDHPSPTPDDDGPSRTPDAWRDTVVTGADMSVPRLWLDRARPGLGALQGLAGLFDYVASARRDLAALLADQFPGKAEVPLMEVYAAAHAERERRASNDAGQAAVSDIPDPVERLHDQVLALASDQAAAETVIDPHQVADVLAAAPGHVRPAANTAVQAQLTSDGGLLVVNDIVRGARAPARVARLHKRATGELPPQLAARPQGGTGLAVDVVAPLASNLNLRTDVDMPVLMVPGCELAPPAWRDTVDPTDLVVRAHPDAPQLWWPARDTQVFVHPTGLMSELWMPPFLVFLMGCFSDSPRKPPFLQDWARRAALQEDEVATFPRVRLGAHVVAERRTHIIDLDAFPAPQGQIADAALIDVERFRRAHDLPRRGYVRVIDLARFGRATTVLEKERKPLFVDLASPVWLDQIARLARTDGVTHMVLQEALPDPANQPAYADGQRRVTELVLEVSRVVGPQPQPG